MEFENTFKQFLRESGCTEEAMPMSKEELLELQEAINNSKDTASLETVQREFSQESPGRPPKRVGTRQRSQTKSPADMFEAESSDNAKPQITFHDLPEPSAQFLKIIHHKPIFELPIATNPRYDKLSVRERAKLLGDYHSKMGACRAKLARRSILRAPYPDPIQASNRCKNSLLKHPDDDGDPPPDPIPPDIYTSRAGRQIKRKVYVDDAEIDEDDDFVFSAKKNKPFDTDAKITLDNLYVPEEHVEEEKKAAKNRKDTPRRSPPGTKKGRAGLIMSNSAKEATKMKQKQSEVTDFMKTLSPLEDEEKMLIDDDSPTKEVDKDDNEENFSRIRVPPPSRKNNRMRKQQSQEDFDKITVVPESPTTTLSRKYQSRTPLRRLKSKGEEVTLTKLVKTSCPICDRSFLLNEIENHAASCGDDDPLDAQLEHEERKCALCDRLFSSEDAYLNHVKHCMASSVDNM